MTGEFCLRSSAENLDADSSLVDERECLLPTIRVGCDGAYFNFQIGVFLGGAVILLQHRIRLRLI